MKEKRTDVRRLAQVALLVAIEVVMYYTPLGMFPLPGQYASLLTVPVAVGAMLLGPVTGGILGGIFGILSFWQALQTGTLIGAGVSLPAIFVLCVPTRILMGILTGWVFRLVDRIDRSHTVSCFVGGIAAPLLNTVLYMGVFVVILMHNELLQSVLAGTVGEQVLEYLKRNVILFVAAYVGVQALIEAGIGCVVSGGICKVLRRVLKK